jgi:hypothetical protein
MIEKLVSDVKDKPLYYLTMVASIVGAFFASDASSFYRAIGYFIWIFSNGYLLLHFKRESNAPMIIQFIFYEILNSRGFINNLK